jgi:hypothetical protein
MRRNSLIFCGVVLKQMPFSSAADMPNLEECTAGSQADLRRCLDKASLESVASLAAVEKAAFSAISN